MRDRERGREGEMVTTKKIELKEKWFKRFMRGGNSNIAIKMSIVGWEPPLFLATAL